ncbi:MAG: secondary thiamine-phosphate synthase enzyme YjbQ [Planctomycetota bacterium]
MASVEIIIESRGRGLREITHEIAAATRALLDGGASPEGLCTIFVRHTSCSLVIQENADPSARHDLERWLNRLVPEGDELYTHTSEGADDMPAHIKAALTATSIGVPMLGGRLALGTWQGVYLWEHRRSRHERRVVVHVGA